MTYRKKLIEVALPLEAINKEATREKSIRHGHPSTLRLWWARQPRYICRPFRRELDFRITSVDCNINKLRTRREIPT
jgi:hypothetical protein